MTIWDKPPKRESKTQRDTIEYGTRRGWFIKKIEFKSERGSPDLFAARGGVILMIEMKREGEEPKRQQDIRIAELRSHGVTVHVIDKYEDAWEILR